jgi:hypothetical protein
VKTELASLDAFVADLERDPRAFVYRYRQGNPATAKEFAIAEKKLGRKVPPDLKQLYTAANGVQLIWGHRDFDEVAVEKLLGQMKRWMLGDAASPLELDRDMTPIKEWWRASAVAKKWGIMAEDVIDDGGLGHGSTGVIWLSTLRELFDKHELFTPGWRREFKAAQTDPWTFLGRTFPTGKFYDSIYPFDSYANDDQIFLLDDKKTVTAVRIYQLVPDKVDSFELAIPDYIRFVVNVRGSRDRRRTAKPSAPRALSIREVIEDKHRLHR